MRTPALPLYFEHPKTGVVVIVEVDAVTTVANGKKGDPRRFAEMSLASSDSRIWNSLDEVRVLRRASWKEI